MGQGAERRGSDAGPRDQPVCPPPHSSGQVVWRCFFARPGVLLRAAARVSTIGRLHMPTLLRRVARPASSVRAMHPREHRVRRAGRAAGAASAEGRGASLQERRDGPRGLPGAPAHVQCVHPVLQPAVGRAVRPELPRLRGEALPGATSGRPELRGGLGVRTAGGGGRVCVAKRVKSIC